MKKRFRLLSVTLLTSLFVGLFTGCGTTGSTTELAPASDSTSSTASATAGSDSKGDDQTATETTAGSSVINIAISGDPSFTPEDIGDGLMATVGLVREGLFRQGDGVITDGLAESYEHNDDYTEWTFHLRESGWNNGDPVTADDWVYAIAGLLDGTFQLSFPDFLYEVKNAREVFNGEVGIEELGVKAVDDQTLVFELNYPVVYFPALATHPMHFGFDRAFAESVGPDKVGYEVETSLSNGPFYIESWTHDDLIVLKKNEYYWNKDNIAVDQVNVYIIPDESTQVNLFLNGELDVIDVSTQKESALVSAGYDIKNYNNGRSAYLQYNFNNEIIANDNIRKAISSAIDRESIVAGVLKKGTVGVGLVPAGLAGDGTTSYRDIIGDVNPYPYDLTKAQEYLAAGLAELGIAASDIKLTLVSRNSDEYVTVGGAIQQLLQENLGITVEVEPLDGTSFRQRRNDFDYDIALISWGADWDDATNFLGGWEHAADANNGYYKSETFNELYQKATYSTDVHERVVLLGEAEKVLLEEQGLTTLYYSEQSYVTSNRVDGILRRAVVPYLDLYFASTK